MSTTASSLQEEPSIDEFFNLVATETLALFDHLEFDFLTDFDVFAPARRGRTRDHHPPALFRAFLHCYYKDIYGIRPVTRELQNTLVWLSCGFDRPPSRDAVDRFLTDLEHVVDDVEMTAPSRPGYLRTPLADNRSPSAQTALFVSLLDESASSRRQ